MAQAQGKSISELGTAQIYMSNDDLALISQKQASGAYTSKAVKKEALEKLTVSGDRDAQTRSANSYKTLQFVDNSSAHLGTSYIQAAFYANGENVTQIITRKKIGEDQVDGVIGLVVQPNKSRYGYCTADGFGVGPQPTSSSGANVYIQGSNGAIELHPPASATHGGYVDFHYAGSTADYTSRLIEDSSNFQLISTNKNIIVKANDSGKQVILNATANNATLQNAPTIDASNTTSKAIATVGWVGKNFLPASSFIDPSGDIQDASDAIAALAGLLNKQHLVIYVDANSSLKYTDSYVLKTIPGNAAYKGVFLNAEATKMTPVNSLYDAIGIAKKIKFLENACCYIRILSDLSFGYNLDDSYQQIQFAHPDLVQNKLFSVQGWNGGSSYNSTTHEFTGLGGSATVRKLSIDLTKPAIVLKNERYCALISVMSHVWFSDIAFIGGLGMTHFNDGRTFALKSEYKFESYFIRNFGNDKINLLRCLFKGCDFACEGSGFTLRNIAFSFCRACLGGLIGQRCDIYNGLNVNNCEHMVYSTFGGSVYVSTLSTPCKWKIYTSQTPMIAGIGGAIYVTVYQPYVDIALVEDSAGTITIPGDSKKYKRAPSATDATKVNTNLACFDVAKIVPSSISAIQATKRTTNGSVESTAQFLRDFFDSDANGYTNNGFAQLSYSARSWLKLFLDTTSSYADTEIPESGIVSF